MQVTQGPYGLHKEFFGGRSDEEVAQKMESRLTALQAEGHTLKKRIKIGRNQACPCGSDRKFKKCCILKMQ